VDTFSFRASDGSLSGPPATVTVVVTHAYRLVDLGTLGGTFSTAREISNGGHVVGSARDAQGRTRPFLWQGGFMRDVAPPGAAGGSAFGVNALGQVVGESDGTGGSRGFVWEDGRFTYPTTADGRPVYPAAVNASGTVAGRALPTPVGHAHAYLWRAGQATDLGTLGGPESVARALNNLGTVVGESQVPESGGQFAFRWDADGGMTPLQATFVYPSTARGVNDAGQIVGGLRQPDSTYRAWMWDGGRSVDLGTLLRNSHAEAINNQDVVVGASSDTAEDGGRAFYWHGGLMLDLNGLLQGPSQQGVVLVAATGINDHGQIVGQFLRTSTGRQHAFLLTPVTDPPAVTAAAFDHRVQPPRVRFTLSADVSASLDRQDLEVRPVGPGSPITPSSHAYDPATGTATFTFDAPLPNGNYRATLKAAGVTDAAGVPLASDYVLDFWVLNGDVTRDRRVDGSDFAILAGNFGKTGRSYQEGDLNGDGRVDGSDFALLAGNFGKSVPPPAAAAVVPARAVAPPPAPPTAQPPATAPAAPPASPRRAPPPPRRRVVPRRHIPVAIENDKHQP
jgi:probable HAF family extracellular repeat protein